MRFSVWMVCFVHKLLSSVYNIFFIDFPPLCLFADLCELCPRDFFVIVTLSAVFESLASRAFDPSWASNHHF